jgi:chromosome segregation ATPase
MEKRALIDELQKINIKDVETGQSQPVIFIEESVDSPEQTENLSKISMLSSSISEKEKKISEFRQYITEYRNNYENEQKKMREINKEMNIIKKDLSLLDSKDKTSSIKLKTLQGHYKTLKETDYKPVIITLLNTTIESYATLSKIIDDVKKIDPKIDMGDVSKFPEVAKQLNDMKTIYSLYQSDYVDKFKDSKTYAGCASRKIRTGTYKGFWFKGNSFVRKDYRRN